MTRDEMRSARMINMYIMRAAVLGETVRLKLDNRTFKSVREYICHNTTLIIISNDQHLIHIRCGSHDVIFFDKETDLTTVNITENNTQTPVCIDNSNIAEFLDSLTMKGAVSK